MTILTGCEIAYLETILWAETVCLPCDENDLIDGCMDVPETNVLHGVCESEPLDDYFSYADFDVPSLRKCLTELAAFFRTVESEGLYDQAREYGDDEQLAHDFWLTRNGHGAGFWDGDYGDFVGGELTRIAKRFSEQTVLVNLDGSIGVY